MTQTTSSSAASGSRPEPGRPGAYRAGTSSPRWLRQSLSSQGQPRAEFTAWADEQLHRNVIPAEHRAALMTELRHWLSIAPSTDRRR